MTRHLLTPEDEKFIARWQIGVIAFYLCLALGIVLIASALQGPRSEQHTQPLHTAAGELR